MESTYGDREHETAGDLEMQFGSIINDTIEASLDGLYPCRNINRSSTFLDVPGRLPLEGP